MRIRTLLQAALCLALLQVACMSTGGADPDSSTDFRRIDGGWITFQLRTPEGDLAGVAIAPGGLYELDGFPDFWRMMPIEELEGMPIENPYAGGLGELVATDAIGHVSAAGISTTRYYEHAVVRLLLALDDNGERGIEEAAVFFFRTVQIDDVAACNEVSVAVPAGSVTLVAAGGHSYITFMDAADCDEMDGPTTVLAAGPVHARYPSPY